MKMRHPWTWLPLFMALSGGAQASVVIMGTRLIYDENQGARDVTVQARNDGEQPSMVQVWLDDGDVDASPSSVNLPLRVTPADARVLKAGQGQSYRLTYAPGPTDEPLPTDRETVLYFNLLDIPPKPDAAHAANTLQFAVRSRIKLFYRPKGLEGNVQQAMEQLDARLQESGGKQYLHLKNPSLFHLNLVAVTVGQAQLDAQMLAPGEQLILELPTNERPKAAQLRWLDDFGAARQFDVRLDS